MSTTELLTTKDLLVRMDRAWWPFRLSATWLSGRAMEQPTSAGWTYKEMLAHVAAWHELAARRIRAFRETGETDPGKGPDAATRFDGLGLSEASRDRLLREWDMDAFNAAVRESASARPAADVLRDLAESYRRLRAEVERLSDEQASANVADGRSFALAVVEGDTFGHYQEHQGELLAGTPSTGTALAARIDDEWGRFRDAIRHLGRGRLTDRIPDRAGVAAERGEAAPTGWTTYKDLIAHVIGWLQDIPRRVEAIRAGTHKPIASRQEIDEYNARSVADRALVGPEALLDELDTSYRLMRDAVIGLTEAEVRDPKVLALVATRTYLHWEEHRKELPEVVRREDLAERGLDGW
jgi:hypothetical protein